MSRYLGSITKKSRRYGFSLLENEKEFFKGKKRRYPPGQHGLKRTKLTDYGQQLREKQKIKFLYGLNDTQFRRIFLVAKKMRGLLTLNVFLVLESRLDNLVYRMGFAATRKAARQLVNHGHVLVDGKKVDIPSYIVSVNQVISLKSKVHNLPVVMEGAKNPVCKYVDVDQKTKTGKYARLPERSELPSEINESYVVEWYNRLV